MPRKLGLFNDVLLKKPHGQLLAGKTGNVNNVKFSAYDI